MLGGPILQRPLEEGGEIGLCWPNCTSVLIFA
jgi:hypothetical protein